MTTNKLLLLLFVSFFPFLGLAEFKTGPKITYFEGSVESDNGGRFSGFGIGPRVINFGETFVYGVDLFRTYPELRDSEVIQDTSFEGFELGPFAGLNFKNSYAWIGHDLINEIESLSDVKTRDGFNLGKVKYSGFSNRIGFGFTAFDFMTINLEYKRHFYSLDDISNLELPDSIKNRVNIETEVIHVFFGFFFR